MWKRVIFGWKFSNISSSSRSFFVSETGDALFDFLQFYHVVSWNGKVRFSFFFSFYFFLFFFFFLLTISMSGRLAEIR